VSFTFPPGQKVVGPFAVIVTTGNGRTLITVAALVVEHPVEFVTVTV
jgi:hypothetical protein